MKGWIKYERMNKVWKDEWMKYERMNEVWKDE